jgi:hypothetical protein
MMIRSLSIGLALVAVFGASSATADAIEHLEFTGTATCLTGEFTFDFPECSPGSSGPVTGNYFLDVNEQTIVGPWSFTTPFGSFSSGDSGAIGEVFDGVMNLGVSYDFGQFEEETATFNQVLALAFTNTSEVGAITTIGVLSEICQSVPGSNPPGCEPDVAVAGATALISSTPEPSSIAFHGIGILLMGAALWFKRRRSTEEEPERRLM